MRTIKGRNCWMALKVDLEKAYDGIRRGGFKRHFDGSRISTFVSYVCLPQTYKSSRMVKFLNCFVPHVE